MNPQGSIGGITFDMSPEGIAKLNKQLAAQAESVTPASSPQATILAQQGNAVNSLKFAPIDIPALSKQAEEQAASNAAKSLALERELAPGVAATRIGLQQQVADNLALSGALPADVANKVTRTALAQSGGAGLIASSSPNVATHIGLTSLDLQNQRQNAAMNLLAANPAPLAGLDPAALANLSIANTNAQNQFALGKLGAQANLANSQIGALNSSLLQNAGGGGFSLGGGGKNLASFNPTAGTPANGGFAPTNPLYGKPYANSAPTPVPAPVGNAYSYGQQNFY